MAELRTCALCGAPLRQGDNEYDTVYDPLVTEAAVLRRVERELAQWDLPDLENLIHLAQTGTTSDVRLWLIRRTDRILRA